MPFSPDRTKEIQSRIDARLQSGQANDWEVSFLGNMAERFQKYGTNTRLSKAQYASLHKALKLERERIFALVLAEQHQLVVGEEVGQFVRS